MLKSNLLTRFVGTFLAELQKPIGWMTGGCVAAYMLAYFYFGLTAVYQIIPLNRWVPLTLIFVSFALGIAALTRKDTNRIVVPILLIGFFAPIFPSVLQAIVRALAVVFPKIRDWLT